MKKRLRLIITILAVVAIAMVVAVPFLRPSPVKEVEITSGVSEGESVILHPSNQIEDGVRLESQ